MSPTDWISCALSYIIVQRPPSSCGRHNFALIQPVHGQGYNPDIPRPDAPVIYTGAFPILTARQGRRSKYNSFSKTRHSHGHSMHQKMTSSYKNETLKADVFIFVNSFAIHFWLIIINLFCYYLICFEIPYKVICKETQQTLRSCSWE